MFKSVFTKYVITFMLIIVISFMTIAITVTTMFQNYTINAKKTIIDRSSYLIINYLKFDCQVVDKKSFNIAVNKKYSSIRNFISNISPFDDDLKFLITNLNGNVLINDYSESQPYVINKGIPKDVMLKVINADTMIKVNTTGVFDTEHLSFAIPILGEDDTTLGALFVCSSSAAITEMVQMVIKTMVMAILWVILIALIAVYFLSERITAPLKKMSSAARSFAAGNFSIRVQVKGQDEVAELANAFNNMAEQLEKLEEMRRGFLANVSHDLRTPMTTIAGFIDGILDGAIPPEKYQYYLTTIGSEVRRLSRLVSSLLDLSRIEAGDRKFNFETFDICETARRILISFEKKIDDKKLDVEFISDDDNMYVYADKDAIYQVLYNLCENAVKFSDQGGKYRIKIQKHDKRVYVSVFNEGKGIIKEDLPFVFDRFYKSDKSRGLDKTGVGLGLHIVKTIIDAHKEEIWVKSTYGESCEFIFTLKATEAPKSQK